MSRQQAANTELDAKIFGDDRYGSYEELRESHPVYWCESMQSYLITRYEDVAGCLKGDNLTTERLIWDKMENLKSGETDFFKDIIDVISTWMIYNDKPVHTRLRKFMNRAFMKKELDAIKPEIVKLTNKVIDRIKASDNAEFNFIEDFAHPLPAMILCKMLGLHEDHVDTFIRWSDDIANFMQDFVVSPIPNKEIAETTKTSMREMFDFLHKTIKERRIEPQNDLISRLVPDQEGGEEDSELTDAEIAAQTIHLIFGGHKIPQFMLANVLNTLFLYKPEMDQLRADPTRINKVLDEAMRYEGPIQYITRHVANDFTLNDVELKKGDSVFLMLGAANRDSRVYSCADEFMPDRNDVKHLAFGGGHHVCIGAAFVRIEMEIMFSLLLESFEDLQPLYDFKAPQWTDNATFHGIQTMPVKAVVAD